MTDFHLALSLVLNYVPLDQLRGLLVVDQFSQAALSLKPILYWKKQFEMLCGREVDFNPKIDWNVACSLLENDCFFLSGRVKYLELGLSIGLNPAAHQNRAIRVACSNGQLKVVKFLLQDSRVDLSAFGNEAIRGACQNNHPEVLKLLLEDSRVNPAAGNNCAIQLASAKGHLEVLKLLLQDWRVNPLANNGGIYWARTCAWEVGRQEVVTLLDRYLLS